MTDDDSAHQLETRVTELEHHVDDLRRSLLFTLTQLRALIQRQHNADLANVLTPGDPVQRVDPMQPYEV